MIPKTIHYCWFGKNPKPENVLKCIETWRQYLPDYKIIEWNETNFDINQNPFVKQAYEKKMWAFVSDFARLKAVYENGGFYLDTDMEVTRNFDELLDHRAICGYEFKGRPFSAFFASEPNHEFIKELLSYYIEQTEFKIKSNTDIFSDLLKKKYNASHEDIYQELENGVTLFPSHYFSLDVPKNFVIHHFEGSWLDKKQKTTYKEMVNMYGSLKYLVEKENGKAIVKDLVYNRKVYTIDQILDQIPLQYIIQYLKIKILKKIKIK